MKVELYKCDICGAVKQEANHWYRASRNDAPSFYIVPRHDEYTATKEMHLCGLECAGKAMHKALAGEGKGSSVPDPSGQGN